jgi:glucan 1,4-alpha-glucosidase
VFQHDGLRWMALRWMEVMSLSKPETQRRRSGRSHAPGGALTSLRSQPTRCRLGSSETWTTGAKDGLGTAYYSPASGPSRSNVWFTLCQGVLTEVYYPDVSCPNLRLLQLVVTDGETFFDAEETETEHQIEPSSEEALLYTQTNVSTHGRYRIAKTYVTHVDAHALAVQVDIEILEGHAEDYAFYVYSNPTPGNNGAKGYADVLVRDGRTYATAVGGEVFMALSASCEIASAACGHAVGERNRTALKEQLQWSQSHADATAGSVTQIVKLRPNCAGKRVSFVLALGFGSTMDAALDAAQETLNTPFAELKERYIRGWRAYLAQLCLPTVGSRPLLQTAAMVLKAHEDKRHPGAIIASLTIPWGDHVTSSEGGVGGYHLVWSRDFYQVASTLAALGEPDLVQRALEYLDEIQQLPDGSFPQNSWLDGRPYWRGLQMDQVAFPILLAYQLTESRRYETLVRPAADFIVDHGPHSAQERWEENAGYSPSTLAAQIAGLVVAAEMARSAKDFGRAAVYLTTADDWARRVEQWTVCQAGSLADHPYFLRVSDTKQPDDGHYIEIKNGGGWHPKSDIVDAGFLELVRLGIVPADDETVCKSLDVVDRMLRYMGKDGPVWRRYNQDGYGETEDGHGYQGAGVGRPWPLLTGERGEYEVAWSVSRKRHAPGFLYGPEALLRTMEKSANRGLLIPEQIWDGEEMAEFGLYPGQGTGSATPLAWAMAQYLRLAKCIEEGRVIETPDLVEQRYQTQKPSVGPAVEIDEPVFDACLCRSTVRVYGRTLPGATVVIRGREAVVAQADQTGSFSVDIQLWMIGRNVFQIIGYDNQRAVSSSFLALFYHPVQIGEWFDRIGDDAGPGCYTYPTHPDFQHGDFDLRRAAVSVDDQWVYFEVDLAHLDNPWEGPNGISKQLVDIYIQTPVEGELRSYETFGLNAKFRADCGWNRLVRVFGDWSQETTVVRADGTVSGNSLVCTDPMHHRIRIRVSIDSLGGVPSDGWKWMVLVAGEENGQPRPVRRTAGDWDFGGGSEDGMHSAIIDMLDSPEFSQEEVLDWTREQFFVGLPMIDMIRPS